MLQALRTGIYRVLLGLAVFAAGAAQFQDVAFSVHRAMHVINASGAALVLLDEASGPVESPASGAFLDGDCGLCHAHHLSGSVNDFSAETQGAAFEARRKGLPESALLVSLLDHAQAPRAPPVA